MQCIGIPSEALKRINQISFRFIWKRRYTNTKAFEKIKRTVMCSPYSFGGMNMINIMDFQASLYLHWAERLITKSSESWTLIPLASLKDVGGLSVFRSSVKPSDSKGLDLIKSSFWKKVVETWLKHNVHTNPSTGNIINDPLFNNKYITYKKRTLFLPQLIQRNVVYVKDLCINNRMMSFPEFIEKYGNYAKAPIDYNIVRNAVPQNMIRK